MSKILKYGAIAVNAVSTEVIEDLDDDDDAEDKGD